MRQRWSSGSRRCAAVGCQPSPPPEVRPAAAAADSSRRRDRCRARRRRCRQRMASIAVANFLGLYDAVKKTPGEAAQRVSMLSTHAQYFGVLDDYEAALADGGAGGEGAPDVPEALLAARGGARVAAPVRGRARRSGARAGSSASIATASSSARAGVLDRRSGATTRRCRFVERIAEEAGDDGDARRARAADGRDGRRRRRRGAVHRRAGRVRRCLAVHAGVALFSGGAHRGARGPAVGGARAVPGGARAAAAVCAGRRGTWPPRVALAGDASGRRRCSSRSSGERRSGVCGAARRALAKRGGNEAVRRRMLVREAGTRYDELLRRHRGGVRRSCGAFLLGAGDDAGGRWRWRGAT